MTGDLAKKYRPNLSILIADDHSLTRSMVKAILRGVGFENITHAENGLEAVQEISTGKIDVVICDWNMPKASGLEVLRTVRSDARFTELPFLMLTAEAYRENIVAASQAGVSTYVIKPFTADVLLSKLEEVLKPFARSSHSTQKPRTR
jgi:two-component system chemotaxis response regulator CheY